MLKSLLLACVVFTAATPLSAQGADSLINGEWRLYEEGVVIRMAPEADRAVAGIILRSRESGDIGRVLLRVRSVASRNNDWRGQLFRPDNGAVVGATARVVGRDTLIVVAKKMLLSRTLRFTRVVANP